MRPGSASSSSVAVKRAAVCVLENASKKPSALLPLQKTAVSEDKMRAGVGKGPFSFLAMSNDVVGGTKSGFLEASKEKKQSATVK